MSDRKWFPAMKLEMGNWEYYSVRMTFEELIPNVTFNRDLDKPSVLDEFMQRDLVKNRSTGIISSYLAGRDDRFFSSVVIACLGDDPQFQIMIPNQDAMSEMNMTPEDLGEDLGFIKLDSTQRYFILDGQHRVMAAKHVLEEGIGVPGFKDEEVNVLLVSRNNNTEDEWREKYRRLFTSLNRYAKPTNTSTNIIMDEDDIFYIVTRMLVLNLSLFQFDGIPHENPYIEINSNRLDSGKSCFTTLETLAKFNEKVLTTNQNNRRYWGSGPKLAEYKQFRPTIEADDSPVIETVYQHLYLIWECILEILPELATKNYTSMRSHDAALDDPDASDHFLLWPIGLMDCFGELARECIDADGLDVNATKDQLLSALKPLGKLQWDLRKAPWNYLILVEKRSGKGIVDQPAKRVAHGTELCRLIMGVIEDDEESLESYKETSYDFLIDEEIEDREAWWEEILELKNHFNH